MTHKQFDVQNATPPALGDVFMMGNLLYAVVSVAEKVRGLAWTRYVQFETRSVEQREDGTYRLIRPNHDGYAAWTHEWLAGTHFPGSWIKRPTV